MDSISAEVGSTVELSDVLLIASNGDVRVGRPTIEGARVLAEVVEHGRDRKIIVFKYKAKTRYRRRRGHRQGYTRLAVRQIVTAEGVIEAEAKPKRRAAAKAAAKPARRARKTEPEAAAPAAEAVPVEAASVEAPAVEAKPARRTRAPKAEPEAPAETEKPKRTRKKTETE